MRRTLSAAGLVLALAAPASGHGLLIPEDRSVPPLAMLDHHVRATVDDQAAVTAVEQTFRNHTSRELEATYLFPVPAGASVSKFSMRVGEADAEAELVEADRAAEIYNELVRRTRDPALLEYVGTDLLRLRIFPVPAASDVRVSLSFTSIAGKDHDLVEYVYPLRTAAKAARTLEEFTLEVNLKSRHPITNVYSPTHEVEVDGVSDREVKVTFASEQALLDKDFLLFYSASAGDVGMTTMPYRPLAGEDGYVMLLVSPRTGLAEEQQVPRDVVFVLDTSGSMRDDGKLEQAKEALGVCLDGLSEKDRFGLVTFATTVNPYKEELSEVGGGQILEAKKWVRGLKPSGGTAIEAALRAALALRGEDEGRIFTVVFFTDGQPTIGETDPEKLLAQLDTRNTARTRIFTFGVGYDLDAALLDQIAERTRAASSYARPEEDLKVKATSFFGKITHPVLANLRLSVAEDVRLVEVYPPQLPDLFHGDQLVVLARYQGEGKAAVTLTGTVGMEGKEFRYEVEFPAVELGRSFVEELWVRRKVGYLLDQIRINGEKEELVEEVTALAKRHGITTPYTSYLIMPDVAVPVAGGAAAEAFAPAAPAGLARPSAEDAPKKVVEFAKEAQQAPGDLATRRGGFQDGLIRELERDRETLNEGGKLLLGALDQKRAQDKAYENFAAGRWRANQIEELGVNLSIACNNLKYQSKLTPTALRQVAGRNCLELGGVWIDEEFTARTPTLVVKAQSDAYFQLLEKRPELREVFRLGNHLVWVAPDGRGLVIDENDGREELSDAEIDELFAAK